MMTSESSKPPVVAIINSTPDVVDMLRMAFEIAGFVVVTGFTHAIRDGELDPDAFVRLHQPDVIVYDIAPPYKSNWQLFQHICQLPAFQGRPTVITSTNPKRLQELAAVDQAVFEIIETPYEIMKLVNRVRAIVEQQ